MSTSRSDGMYVAHTLNGWVVFDNSLSQRVRLSAPCPTRAAAAARKRSLARTLRRRRAEDPADT